MQAEYTENSGYSMRFFQNIGKFAIIGVKLGLIPNKLGRTHRKFAQFATLHNTTQISEKFSPIVSKIWHFLKCHNNCYFNKPKLLTHKNLKGAINCSYVYCEEEYGKCYKHTPFFFKCTIVSTGATNAQITKTTKTYGYCKLQHKRI